jgi:acyl-CoA thioesterase FadM
MVAAAIDNTLGPLSLMIAPPNLTRTMELRFRRPVTADVDHFTVEGQLTKRQGRRLFFEAKALDPDGKVLTTCKSFHWIIQDD